MKFDPDEMRCSPQKADIADVMSHAGGRAEEVRDAPIGR